MSQDKVLASFTPIKSLNSQPEPSCHQIKVGQGKQEVDFSLAGYDYQLPQERIAQNPASPRDSARLLVVNSPTHHHCVFRDLPELLRPGDLLVIILRLSQHGYKPSGALVEMLLLEESKITNGWF